VKRTTYHDWVCPKCGYQYHSDRGVNAVTHQHMVTKTTAVQVDLRPAPTPAAVQLAMETA
jgi:hypothetical protein